MEQDRCSTIAAAIRTQYDTILNTYGVRESLALRLNDQNASLIMTVQNSKIIMVQLALRNPYPNSPEQAPVPYTDIDADGILENYPNNKNSHGQSSLTCGNYLALLTRFGIPEEVAREKLIPTKILSKDR